MRNWKSGEEVEIEECEKKHHRETDRRADVKDMGRVEGIGGGGEDKRV